MSNFCKQCGKEIPEERKFCSRSCSATFNNLHRSPVHWSEEKRKAFSRRQILSKGHSPDEKVKQECKYCGTVLNHLVYETNRKKGVCADCKPYVQRVKSYKNLGIVEGKLQDRQEQAEELIQKEYFFQGKCLEELSQKYNLSKSAIRGLILSGGQRCRGVGDSLRNSIETGRLVPRIDSIHFNSGVHISWQGQECKYRSSWELKYMQELDSKKIPYLYEFKYFKYFNTVDQKERLACPDFYLPETNEIIELKSSYTIRGKVQELKDKFKVYREAGFVPKLLLDWKFVDLDSLNEVNYL